MHTQVHMHVYAWTLTHSHTHASTHFSPKHWWRHWVPSLWACFLEGRNLIPQVLYTLSLGRAAWERNIDWVLLYVRHCLRDWCILFQNSHCVWEATVGSHPSCHPLTWLAQHSGLGRPPAWAASLWEDRTAWTEWSFDVMLWPTPQPPCGDGLWVRDREMADGGPSRGLVELRAGRSLFLLHYHCELGSFMDLHSFHSLPGLPGTSLPSCIFSCHRFSGSKVPLPSCSLPLSPICFLVLY